MEFNCTNATNNDSVEAYLQSLQDQTNRTLMPAVIFIAALALFGLIGNSLVLFVYAKKFRLNPTRILLMAIASFDLVANVGAIPSEITTMFHYWNFSNPAFCKFKVFLNVFTTVGGAITLLAVAVVRYRKICTPYRWQVTSNQAKFVSGCMAVLSTLFSVPYIILYGRMSKPTPCPTIKGYECYTDDVYKDTIWPLTNNAFFVFLYLCCVVPLTVLYIRIGVQARKRSLGRVTVMLFIITVVYVISYLFFLLLTLYKNIFPNDYNNLNMVGLSVYHFFLRTYYLNCAINPIVYSLCDLNFRREGLRLLGCGYRKQL